MELKDYIQIAMFFAIFAQLVMINITYRIDHERRKK